VTAVDPTSDLQLKWFLSACGRLVMAALLTGDRDERARLRAMAKEVITELPTPPKGLEEPPVCGKTRLLVGLLLQAGFTYMERAALLCWLQYGTDREVWDRELGSAVLSACLYKVARWLGVGAGLKNAKA